MKPLHFLPVLLLIPFTFSNDKYQSIEYSKNIAQKNELALITISRARADELLSKLPVTDPWLVRQDGSALAWGEAATLETLVDLYEATDDPSYLKEVARRGDRLLNHRDDKRGIADGSGKIRPAWSMGLKYVVAKEDLLDTAGKIIGTIRSTPYANNDLTKIVLKQDSKTGRFKLKILH
jgi:hypothetical protein